MGYDKKAADRAYYLAHREQIIKYVTSWKKANPDRVKQSNRKYRKPKASRIKDEARRRALPSHVKRANKLRLKYGITLEHYQYLWESQNGKCAICDGNQVRSGKLTDLFVDHDHVTKKIRGLLCGPCNLGIGSFQDDPARIKLAIVYLNQPVVRFPILAYVKPRTPREYHLRRTYGITTHHIDWLLTQQHGMCAICGSTTPSGHKNSWQIDHEHQTGHIRGLLCIRCNTGVGNFSDDVHKLQRAAEYIEKSR